MKRTEDLHGVLLGHITTIEATYQICRNAIELGIPGDFVECGVFAGAQSAAMARAIQDSWSNNPAAWVGHGSTLRLLDLPSGTRRVHLFDSFSGIPEAGPHDRDYTAGGHKAGASACSLEQVKQYMAGWKIPDELLVYHPGLFEDTMPRCYDAPGALIKAPDRSAVITSIAVLRLDADLYESTRTCMRYLYPLVVPGGWVIVDDWNLDGCRKAIEEIVRPAPVYWRKDV